MPLNLPEPWQMVIGDQGKALTVELEREICSSHKLFGIQTQAIARMLDRDNILFSTNDLSKPYVVVHLTWNVETDPAWPWFIGFTDLQDFESNWRRIYE